MRQQAAAALLSAAAEMWKVVLLLALLLPSHAYAWTHGGDPCMQLDVDGWRILTATSGVGTCTVDGSGNGNGTNTGTCIWYVSATGSDSNDGKTVSTPFLTINKGYKALRTGKPDWLLLKKGSTFTAQGMGDTNGNFAKSGPSCITPMVVSSYVDAQPAVAHPNDPEVRPILQIEAAGTCLKGASYDYLAVVGLDCYSYKRDPANVSFDKTILSTSTTAISAAFGTNQWLLFEDVRTRNFTSSYDFEQNAKNTITVRRSIIGTSYSGLGIYAERIAHLVVQENYFDTVGWSPTLTTPASVTVTCGDGGATPVSISWPSNPLVNGNTVYFTAATGLCTGAALNTAYIVSNLSGSNFNLTLSGVPLNGIGTPSGVSAALGNFQPTVFIHANYYQSSVDTPIAYVQNPINFNYNVIYNSSLAACECISGGNFIQNLVLNNPIGIAVGKSGPFNLATNLPSFFTNNVSLQSQDMQTVVSGGSAIQGFNYTFGGNNTGPITMTGNIAAHSTSSAGKGLSIDGAITGITATGNTFCDMTTPVSGGTGALLSFGSITGGSGYTANTATTSYSNVPFTTLTGTGSTAFGTVTVNGTTGAVTAISIANGGGGGGGATYQIGDTVTVASALVGGAGSGFVATVATVSSGKIVTLTVTNGGSGYASPYNNITPTGGSGSGALVQVAISGGAVTGVYTEASIQGTGYTTSDTLSSANTSIGGTGSGWSVPVVSVSVNTLSNTTKAANCDGLGFPDPNRTIGGYYNSIGNPGGFPSTTAGFMQAIEALQQKGTWDTRLTAIAAGAYIRAGFGF